MVMDVEREIRLSVKNKPLFYLLYFFGGSRNLNRYKQSIKNHTKNYTVIRPHLIVEAFLRVTNKDYNIYDRLGARPSCSHLLKLCNKNKHSKSKYVRKLVRINYFKGSNSKSKSFRKLVRINYFKGSINPVVS
jgi:hypothetical protein